MNDCNNCAYLKLNKTFGEYKCEKGRDPLCQMRKGLCFDHESLGAYYARISNERFKKEYDDTVKKETVEINKSTKELLKKYLRK